MKCLYAIAVLLFILSCKKEKEPKTKVELLTTGNWHVTSYTVEPALDWDGDGTEETNIYPVMDDCVKDDFTTFHDDGTGELNEGASKCSVNDPQANPFVWEFQQEGTRIGLQGVSYLLESLTETQLVVKEINVISTVSHTHTVTFAH